MVMRMGSVDRGSRALSLPHALVAAAVVAMLGAVGLTAPSARAAGSCPNATYRVGYATGLPDCRAYELVSPADKDNATLQYQRTSGNGFVGYPSADGQHFAFAAVPPFADPVTGLPAYYVDDRTDSGWTTRNIQSGGCLDVVKAADSFVVAGFTDDFSSAIMKAPATQNCAPGDEAGGDLYLEGPDRSLRWVSQNGQPKTLNITATFAGTSADASHIVFATTEKLVLPLDGGQSTGTGLYDRTGGALVPVAVDDDGSLINACGAGVVSGQGVVSTDGRVIFFTSGSSTAVPGCSPTTDDGGQLYARIDGHRTLEVSLPTAATLDPGGRKLPVFLGATRDGTKAFFRSGEALTDDAAAGGGLYEYDLSAVLSGTSSTGTLSLVGAGPGGNGFGIALAGLSDDGTRVYFISTDVLAPGATAGSYNLYLADHGATPSFVATMTGYNATVSVSRDGSEAVFLAKAPDGTMQAYRYALGASGLTCVSCPPAGVAGTGDVKMYGASSVVGGRPDALGPLRFITDDGRVFFNSPDRLADGDVNDVYDVYEYTDGRAVLLSSGVGVQDALLMGASDDGHDVFFVTNESLVGQDFDNGDQDVYDARVDGGFAPPAAPPACAGTDCQPPATAAPALSVAASLSFAGAGNVAGASPSTSLRGRRPVVGARRTVRGTKARLRVRVPGKGRIQVAGHGVRRVQRAAKRAGTFRVVVRLTRHAESMLARRHQRAARTWRRLARAHRLTHAARRALSRRASLPVTIRVRFAAGGGTSPVARVRVRFKQSGREHRTARGADAGSARAVRRAHTAAGHAVVRGGGR